MHRKKYRIFLPITLKNIPDTVNEGVLWLHLGRIFLQMIFLIKRGARFCNDETSLE